MAPIYTFVGDTAAILTGLIQGVNAHHVAAPGNPEVGEGSTVVASPGDSIDTGGLVYPAYFLRDESTGEPSVTATEAPMEEAPAPDPAPAVVEPVAPVDSTVTDPAPAPAETVTVDPAPADATATTTDPAPTF